MKNNFSRCWSAMTVETMKLGLTTISQCEGLITSTIVRNLDIGICFSV